MDTTTSLTTSGESVKQLREFTLKEKIYYVTNDSVPREYVFERVYSAARGYRVFSLILTLVAVLVYMILSEPMFYFPPPDTPLRRAKEALIIIEFIDLSYITLEYFLRLFTAPKLRRHMKDPWAIIDLLTFVPFWINVALYYTSGEDVVEPDVGIVRFFNIFRFLRLFKVTRHTRVGRVLTTTIKRSVYPVLMFYQQAIVLVMISGTIMFYAEQSGSSFDFATNQWVLDDGTVSPFQSILISLWWAVVTIATVGYGDMVPQTPLGRFAGGIIILTGVLVVALPVGVFASTFAEVAKEYDERFRQERAERKRRKQWNTVHGKHPGTELREQPLTASDYDIK